MKNNQAIIILTILLIITIPLFVLGCANGGGGKNTADAVQSTESEIGGGAETSSAELQPNLPADITFDDYEFVFMVRGESYVEWQSQDIYAAEQTGEPVNDAVYTRNLFLEDKYKIRIKELGVSGDIANAAKKSIQAGSYDFDVVMANTNESASLASQGFVYDLHLIPYLDLKQPWWDGRAVTQLTIGNILYFMTGDLSIMANDATWIMMFNKNLVTDFSLDVPYDLVNGNMWTFDKMYEMMNVVAADLDGNGTPDWQTDRYGLATHDSTFDGLFFGSSSHIISKDQYDMPYLDMNNERLVGVVAKSVKLMMETNLTMNSSALGLQPVRDLQPVFQSGRSLFYGEVMQCIIRLRAMEIDFGVIPFPKYDEAQESYNHFIHPTACMVTVPLVNTELERTGIILEAMAAKSKYTLQEAYYFVCLEGKFMRDVESKDMLDIIVNTRNYDIGYIYNWGNLSTFFMTVVKANGVDFVSKYAKAETSALTAMDKTINDWLS